ncbi:Aldehyde/histidinol dehydrogenase [Leucosporidium creatinivorum]|uniref:Aldehyde/histidinol dehydrogenase n=1 Tax=Leucosporidium creatinivorum TaxID=106004 RepID=A0A1Y2G446_9BASI|nr:Aldehyde/histidinol dehydrogenase [Leucosporidium creatinivorum]
MTRSEMSNRASLGAKVNFGEIAQANDTMYGLAAAVFSRDVSRALNTAKQLKAGTPFGGYKQSGIGRELGEYALANYTRVKVVHINLEQPHPL